MSVATKFVGLTFAAAIGGLVGCAGSTHMTGGPGTAEVAQGHRDVGEIATEGLPGSVPEAVVAAQLDAYNRRDLEAFMTTFAVDAELFAVDDATPRARGHEELRVLYGALFEASPTLHSELLHRAVLGRRVVDHERITGRGGAEGVLELVMVYEVEAGKIRRAWSIRG